MSEADYDPLKLKNQLCFPIYACARAIIRAYQPLLSRLDLTYTQYLAMMVLWERRQVLVKEAGALLYLDSNTLTPLFRRLEQKGYVTRCRSSADERELVVSITEKGLALREEALSVPGEMASCVKLSPEKIGTLYTLLYELLDTLTLPE